MKLKSIFALAIVLLLGLCIAPLSGCNGNQGVDAYQKADKAAKRAGDRYAKKLEKMSANKVSEVDDRDKALADLDEWTAFRDELKKNKQHFKLSDGSYYKYDSTKRKANATIDSLQDDFISDYKKTLEACSFDDLNASDVTEDSLSSSTAQLDSLAELVNSEKSHNVWADSKDCDSFLTEIKDETDRQDARAAELKLQREAAAQKAEEESRRRFETPHFTVEVPAEWGDWSAEIISESPDGKMIEYSFSYMGTQASDGGGAQVVAVNLSGESTNGGDPSLYSLVRNYPEGFGKASDGFEIFYMEAGAGFFSRGAKLILK